MGLKGHTERLLLNTSTKIVLLPVRASEQGKVIGVGVHYICMYTVCVYVGDLVYFKL